MVSNSVYGYSLDFYTIGVILYEFMTGKPPHYSENQDELMKNITSQ
jgi:protein-serine/threonine kinase